MQEWFIWSNEHDGWWKSNKRGYTTDIYQAGLYTYEEAMDICESANKYNTNPFPLESMVHRGWIAERQNIFDKELQHG